MPLVCRFVDDLFVLNFSNFESFMYLNQDSLNKITCLQKHLVGWIIFSKDFSCNLLDLDVKRSFQDNILYYLVIFLIDNTRKKYVGIEMIHMPHVHSNIFIITKFGIMNSQFYRILRFCTFKDSFISHMVNLIFLLKNKRYPLKILYRGIECCLIKDNVFFDIFWKSGELLVSPLDLCLWCPFICVNMRYMFGMKSQHISFNHSLSLHCNM